MELTKQTSKNNYFAFLWHATLLALAQSFMDVDTIIPAMLLDAGGNAIHVGMLTAIMIGGANFSQLFFSPYLSNKHFKKNSLLLGVNIRILSLMAMSMLFFFLSAMSGNTVIIFIFIIISIFSLSGAFANIGYTDIFGKSILPESRKSFLSVKQIIAGVGVFISAYFAHKILGMYNYPDNYFYMFLIATIALGISSLGFWKLKEEVPSNYSIKNFKAYINVIRHEIKNNRRLLYFLGFVNTLGISIAILPFFILYAKENLHPDEINIGNYLILKIAGVVFTGTIISMIVKKVKYKYLLYIAPILSISLPLYVMITDGKIFFSVVFLIGGIIYSAYSISMKGVLLEISTNKNRAIYTGIAGAGNIIPILFSLFGGWLINKNGFSIFFTLFILIISCSFYFIYKIKCKK